MNNLLNRLAVFLLTLIFSMAFLPRGEAEPVSKGKPTKASSVWFDEEQYTSGKAVDGSFESRWASAGGVKSGWLEVDLERETTISRIVLDESSFHRVTEFEVEIRKEDDWRKTVARGTAIGNDKEIFLGQPVTGRFCRLMIHAASDTPTVSEFQLFQPQTGNAEAKIILEEQAKKAFAWFQRYRNDQTGLVLDRGRNSLEEDRRQLSSIASGGYYLSFLPEAVRLGWIERDEAARQTLRMLRYSLDDLEHDRGFYYHFYNAETGRPSPNSEISVLDTAIFINGVMVASVYFGGEIAETADKLVDRVQWPVLEMTDPKTNKTVLSMAIRKGKLGYQMGIRTSEFLMPYWPAVGSETYPVDPQLWYNCRINRGELQNRMVLYPGSPLFLHYYSLAWQDLDGVKDRDGVELVKNCRESTLANREFCRSVSNRFRTYSKENGTWWGLSAGDSPNGYVAQGPNDRIDGTVWPVTALATYSFLPEVIETDIVRWKQSEVWDKIEGPYGLSPFNLDKDWIGKDLIGIDLGSFLLDWANCNNNTIRDLWMRHPVARKGFKMLEWKQ